MQLDSSLKQQSVGRHVTPLRHIILIPSQLVFTLTPYCCMLSGETQATVLKANTLTITPPTRFNVEINKTIANNCCYNVTVPVVNDLQEQIPLAKREI